MVEAAGFELSPDSFSDQPGNTSTPTNSKACLKKPAPSSTKVNRSKSGISSHTLVTNSFEFENEVETFAKRFSDISIRLVTAANNSQRAHLELSQLASTVGVSMPELSETVSMDGAIQRMISEHWWRRVLRIMLARELESTAILENRVNRFKSIYISNYGLTIYREQKMRNRRMLEQLIAVNEEGEELSMAELADSSVSNPVNRRNELMCRIAGFDQYALEHDHVGLFWTITCPSKMHAILSKSGTQNPNYNGNSPSDSQQYLCTVWARIRAKFKRVGINPYGFRVAEPQHDGTPHWHLLLFMPQEQVETANEIVRTYALMEDGNEKGADQHRFKVETIDRSKGSAVGYIAKYISKNIDGHAVESDLYGEDAKDSSERVTAWASIWGIRQFQQIGGPPVSVWRELRKLKKLTGEELAIESAWLAANSGDWYSFIKAMGGIECGRGAHTVTISKRWCNDENQFGDPLGWIVDGVKSKGIFVTTRLHEWVITLAPTTSASAEGRGCASDEAQFWGHNT